MAEVIERLDVTHNFVTIDSPIKFFIQMNEDTKHRVLKSAQAIQIDCRKLLTRKDMPNIPAWALFIVYDDSLLAEGEKVNWYAHDVDFAGSTDSVNGVLVDVDLSALYAELEANNESLISSLDTLLKSSVLHKHFEGISDFNAYMSENFSDFVFCKRIVVSLYNDYNKACTFKIENDSVRWTYYAGGFKGLVALGGNTIFYSGNIEISGQNYMYWYNDHWEGNFTSWVNAGVGSSVVWSGVGVNTLIDLFVEK